MTARIRQLSERAELLVSVLEASANGGFRVKNVAAVVDELREITLELRGFLGPMAMDYRTVRSQPRLSGQTPQKWAAW